MVRVGGSRLGLPLGGTVSEIPEITYEIGGRERTLRLTGNRLGDNAPRVLFELVEKHAETPKDEVAPTVSVSEEPDEPAGGDEEAHIDGVIERSRTLLGQTQYRLVFDEGLNAILGNIRQATQGQW